MPQRILVIANETCPGRPLHDAVRTLAHGEQAEVLVVAPALNNVVSTWASDIDGAEARAQERVDAVVQELRSTGIEAQGHTGDCNPLVAIQDALLEFPADALVISTHPPGRSRWLARSLPDRARKRFNMPLTHVIVDLEHDRVEVVDTEQPAPR